MSYLLVEATRRLAQILGELVEGTATGGSTTTLVDTARTEADDWFTAGVIWFLSGTNINTSKQITSWDYDTKTFTIPTVNAIAAGVKYAATSWHYPRWLLIQKINQVLQNLVQSNESLTSVKDQEEYDLPSGVHNILRVEVATDDKPPYYYARHQNWKEFNGKLRFDTLCEIDEDDLPIRLTFRPYATAELNDSDPIDDNIQIDMLAWKAAVECLRWRMVQDGYDNPGVQNQLNEALIQNLRWDAQYPINKDDIDPHLSWW